MRIFQILCVPALLLCLGQAQADQSNTSSNAKPQLNEVLVVANRVANDQPASGYSNTSTELRYDPSIELQSRGLAEGQTDVTVLGSVFENTGFKVGAVNIFDPQTGHYVADLGIDPSVISKPALLTGVDSAIAGFNSAIATVAYDIRQIKNGGEAKIGVGSDDLNFQSLNFGHVLHNSANKDLAVAVSVARSKGDGSVPFGDHDFKRASLQLQQVTDNTQSDLILAYQDKFFGWPGAYTGFERLAEIDDTQTTLLLANHRRDNDNGWLEIGGFYRQLEDDYDFDRTTTESGAPGSFEHETKAFGLGFQGVHRGGEIDWRYAGQLSGDELVSSTDLTNGDFTSRSYATLTVVPSINRELSNGMNLNLRAGATADYSNRDSSTVSPLLAASFSRSNERGTMVYALEYAATSQLPGYTVLNSNETGLFGGNPSLGREKAKQLSASFERTTPNWQFRASVFSRRDDNLVDWTYATGAPFARQANAVDLDVVGIQALFVRHWNVVDLTVGYTGIDKDADYGQAQVDASFYALNFAKQRVTVAINYRLTESLELRVDNEYRVQEKNPLRADNSANYLGSASLVWSSPRDTGLGAALVVDNATDSEYQPFPGSPASGRQVSLNASYRW